jgi:dynein heavy chain
VRGNPPKARSDHTASVSGTTIVVQGGRGWSAGKGSTGLFDDTHLLDVVAMEWLEPPGFNPEDDDPASWPKLPSTLWNHQAICVQSVPSDKLFVFGGQKAPREYSNTLAIMDVNSNSWVPPLVAGSAPPAREDSAFAYDPATCNILFFGGWRQKWLNDLWALNVAGVVGPPYAVLKAEPYTGPLTGGTPITLRGLRFIESPMVQVRFTDGKREATVSGQYQSPEAILCKAPDFTKFGAVEVVVRVSINGDPFTVNETTFIYYANTQAKKSMAFGPGLLPGLQAGRKVSFMLQAKDLGGKLRTTGLDPIKFLITGPAKHIDEPEIVDFGDGTYQVSYSVPAAGEYQVQLQIDENPNDQGSTFSDVRGFPCSMAFSRMWEKQAPSGTAARLKSYLRLHGDAASGKIFAYVKDKADKGVPDYGVQPETEAAAAKEAEPASEEGAETAGGEESKEKEAEAKRLPDMVYALDLASSTWSAEVLSESAHAEPDFIGLRDSKLVALKVAGVPELLALAMVKPHAAEPLEDWSLDGKLNGSAPAPRTGFLVEMINGKAFVYGGLSTDGETAFDDVHVLDAQTKTWTRLYSAEIAKGVALSRRSCFCGTKIIAMAKGAVGDAVELVEVLDLAPLLEPKNSDFKSVMLDLMQKQLTDLTANVNGLNQAISIESAEDDTVALHKIMKGLKGVRDETAQLEYITDQMDDMIAYMAKNNMGKTEPLKRKLDAIVEVLSATKKAAPTVRKAVKPLQDAEAMRTIETLAGFEERMTKEHKAFLGGDVFSNALEYSIAYSKLNATAAQMTELEKECAKMSALADLFEFGDKLQVSKDTLAKMQDERIKIKSVWDLQCIVQSQLDEWKRVLWTDIDVGTMEDETKTFTKIVRGLDKSVRDWLAYRGVDSMIKNFATTVPCVADLKSPSMRDRHWQKLMGVTKKQIDVNNPKFSLNDMLALELHNFVDDVGEVVDQAQKEDKMEQMLIKLHETWKSIEFQFDRHAETDVYLIRMQEADFEMLEDNQLVVQGMMASKYLATFEEPVTKWQKELSSVSDVLGIMLDVQRKWAYLETLFIGSEEVKKELPADAERFAEIDVGFKTLLKSFNAEKNCVRACAVNGLVKKLEALTGALELCEKSLADFLEAKRRIFPRFYFVSKTMLLDILSNGNRPWIVAKNVNAMFQGVKELGLQGDPAMTANTMVSNEGEVLNIEMKGPLRLDGKVENYLNKLISRMRDELRVQLGRAIDEYQTKGKEGKERVLWLHDHLAQLVLVVTQFEWTKLTDKALDAVSAGKKDALQLYRQDQLSMLDDCIKAVQGKLDKLNRRKVMNVITLETHSRDINIGLINQSVDRKDHFLWLGQLKTRWETGTHHGSDGKAPDAFLYICDAVFRYSFEYLGCAPRLVITPLTDRIYITATQAAHLILGCAPAGPAGTGKTETTKDLSAQLGKAVYVFNCGPEMDYLTMADIFKGLAASGSWGCFDEFNRLIAEVLSVCSIQFKSVLDGMRKGGDSFRFAGIDYYQHPDGSMSFITMNPGYLGRQELPESLKVLFRPVTVMVPDFQLIMENMLMAEGYTTADVLAKKFFTFYNLNKDLLSKQMHYDWGLRAIKSVLVVAGTFLRAEPDKPEAGLLMRALRDFNLPKIVEDDMVVFMGLLKDLFAEVFDAMPRMRNLEFEELIKTVAVESKLIPSDYFVQNVVDTQDLLDIRHCIFIIGTSGNNKSTTWTTLCKVWTRGNERGKTIYRDINPKAITPNELYGFINIATREWKDGLLSFTMRELANMPDTNPKWIILDGDLDANWIENMNSVMDDNRLLTLASNERIRLLNHMRMIFEIRDLAYASPATVTRAGILFISERQQWKNYVQSWVDAYSNDEPFQVKAEPKAARKAKLEELFAKYCEPVLLELSMNYKHMIPNLLDFGLVQALCNFLQDLLVVDNVGVTGPEHFEIYFVLACVWAFGGAMSITSGVDYRKKFSQYWKDTWKTVKFPHRGEVFDCYVDKAKHEFAAWTEIVPEIAYDSASTPMGQVTVPTSETVAISFWLDNLIKNKHGAMLIGGAGCGKTAIINGKLRSMPEDYSAELVNINYYTNASMFQKILEAPLEKKAGKNYGPPGNKKLIYFVDDLNMAALDNYNTASNISLMRQHIDYGHIYDLNKLSQKVLLNTQYLSAMNPTAGSFIINPRLQRRFNTFAINFPSGECLNSIYATFLLGHLGKFTDEVKELGKRIVQAGLQLHKRVSSTFRKTASNFHYEFNIRHMAGVFQGLLNAQPSQFTDPLKMCQLWLHESERIYGDRLVSKEDLKKYKELAAEQAKKFFKEMSPTSLMAEPLIFCHFAGGVGEKCYDRCPTFNDLSTLLNGALDEYNESNAQMNLVLFEDAMRHIARISRIIEAPGGHALLVGVGGSGKQSLARLATFVAGYSTFQVVITARYSVNDLKADLQVMYRKAGLKSEGISFIFTDQQIADERFLVFMNDLLSSGNIPGLFPNEDMDDIINSVRPAVKRAGLADTRGSCWDYFIQQVVANLHVILCFSPIGDPIKVRTRRFPALVNCVVIDWFQPWPEEALVSVSNRFLVDVDLGDQDARTAVTNFMPYSFLAVNEKSDDYARTERRFNYTTPKSFLELIALYKSMLANRRKQTDTAITRLSNGVLKLESTAKSVGQLEDDLKIKSVEVEEKKAACDAMIPKLEEEKAKATDEAAKANVIAADATLKEVGVKELKAGIEKDLAAAEPALVKASAALDGLDKKDLGELKSLGKPPAGVDDVTGAVIYMLHPSGKGKIDTSWKAAQIMMKDVNAFLNTLMGYKDRIDAGTVPKNNFKLLEPLVEKEWFNVDTMRKKSNAAAGLCDFVLNIKVYWGINENVEPMRLKALEATETLENAIAAKTAALDAKAKAEATVAELTAQFNAAVKEKEDVIAEANMCERKLGLAQRLINALSSEGARWKQGIEHLNFTLGLLVGDVLLAAAFVSYIGCFNKRFRLDLMNNVFLPYMKGQASGASFTTLKNAFALPMSEGADPVKVLTNDAEIASWNNESLPSDKVSIQNGAIVTNCARWPLMIDPQLQGIKWIKKHEEDGLKVCRLGQKSTLQIIGSGIENGSPVLIENIQLQVDAVLNPVIGRQTVKRGRNLVVKLGDKEIDYSPKFRLYLQTKLANPHYPPEIQAETTLVNFMVTEDGLEDQLLSLTVSKERPDLSQQAAALLVQQNAFKIKIKELEDGILMQLATAEGDVTENIELIENLEDSKRVSIDVAEKMIIAKETQIKIEKASELYRPVANRGSLMFFLLSDLFKIHSFHHYSLASFNIVFERAVTGKRPNALEWDSEAAMKEVLPEKKREAFCEALDAAEAAAAAAAGGDDIDLDALQTRLNFLVDRITFNVFGYARRGLLEKHKLIVATMLMLRVKQRMGEIPADEAGYLTTGRALANPPQMTTKVAEYLQEAQWGAACALKDVGAFKALPEDLELNPEAWKEWIESPKPELEDLPGEWAVKCTGFQKLLVLRALRTDRVTSAVTKYIIEEMGDRYISQPTFDMDDTYADSTYATPLFFVLFPGVDPGTDIEALGTKLGYTEANNLYVSISMGQGQEKNAENVLDRFTADGGWVFLQNVHLMQSWLPSLERKLEIAAEGGHKNFRCFLSAEPPPMPDMQTVPEGIMQSSIKVANEPPTDVKSNLRSALALFSQDTFDKSTKPMYHRPMLFALCFFHSLCLGRRKFGYMGFSRPYPYNNGDLTVCAAVLQNYLEANEQTPWQDVRYIAGEIMYGGHITDPWDRRVTNTYLEVLLNPNLTDEKSRFMLAPGFTPLLEGQFTDYVNYIENSSPPESPILFGMHPNAEISLLISLCSNLFFTILTVQGGGGGGGGGSGKEDKVKNVLDGIVESLREEFNMVEIKLRIKEKGNPYLVFLLQELERMNLVLSTMRTQLVELALGLSGALNISDAMDALINSLYLNQVPPAWLKICGQIGPTGTYNRKNLSNWYSDLKLRWKQLENWSAPSKPLEDCPPSVWLSGTFNPMGYVTACMQVTARQEGYSLDEMRVQADVTDIIDPDAVESQPQTGTYIHGLFMEGARWDTTNHSIQESFPKELYPVMPVIHVTSVTADKLKTEGVYQCPIFMTTIHGPTFVFAAPLRTLVPASKWILAGVSLVMQPD